MSIFRNTSVRLNRKQSWKIAAISCLAACCTLVIVPATPVSAEDIPTTVTAFQKVPYSRVFFTGKAYMVKDHDFEADARRIQFSSVWSVDPTNKNFRVAVRYCSPDTALADSGAYLTGMTILDNDRPLVSIHREIGETSAGLEIARSGYYTQLDEPDDAFWFGADPFGMPIWNSEYHEFDYMAPVYTPAVECSAGMSRFDISRLAGAIAQLPDKTLPVQLRFSDGHVEDWHLGRETVEALKQLVAIRDR